MFLSTGAGESASTFKRFQPAVNFEPPWKPARLQSGSAVCAASGSHVRYKRSTA